MSSDEVLGAPVLVGRGQHRRAVHGIAAGQRQHGLVAVHGDSGGAQREHDLGQELRGDRPVHEQRLGGVADARPVRLGVQRDPLGHLQVGVGVDVDVAVADSGLDHGHDRVLHDVVDQAGAAARDDHVDQAAGAHQMGHRLAVGTGHELHGPGRQPGLLGRLGQHADQRGVRFVRRRGAAQQRHVAALEAEAGGVHGHVRAGLVDDRDHAERHPELAHLQPVGQRVAADHLADRVGQRGDVTQALRHRGDPALVERQPVEHRVAEAGVAAVGEVLRVGGQDGGGLGHQRVRHGVQGGVLGGPRQRGKLGGGVLGVAGDVPDVLLSGHGSAPGVKTGADLQLIGSRGAPEPTRSASQNREPLRFNSRPWRAELNRTRGWPARLRRRLTPAGRYPGRRELWLRRRLGRLTSGAPAPLRASRQPAGGNAKLALDCSL